MEDFQIVIKSKTKLFKLDLKELWRYRDLIFLFVKRNFSTRYKQTILGPLWLIISPLVSTLVSTFVFGTIAQIPSDGVPYFIFYMCGNIAWSYFSTCISDTSSTFANNAGVFGKVYFPRLVSPLSTVITALADFAVQVGIFVVFWLYFYFNGADIHITWVIALTPLLIVQLAALGLGFGIIISSLTTKYRDLRLLVSFGISLWMYITPIIYSTSSLPPSLRAISMINPLSPIVEMCRYAFFGVGDVSFLFWIISLITTSVFLAIGLLIFNRVEKTFMDTV